MKYLATIPVPVNRQSATVMPAELQDASGDAWETFVESCRDAGLEVPGNPEFRNYLQRIWACSEFAAQACILEPGLLFELLASGDLLTAYAAGELDARLELLLSDSIDEAELSRVLRNFRRREMLRIACRDLAGWAPLGEVLGDLTGLADACISRTLARLGDNALQQAGGRARKLTPSLVVLGMGKLGAGELNFSSDIDLIFAYPPGGPGWPGGLPGPEAFYLQLGHQLIRALGDRTEHGFVFRVDMRLRPYGDSGPLVLNFDALADYYQLQGREWERYAMIKARPVAGPAAAAEQLMQLLRPFVYRRYLDFGTFESLRGLKEQIAREVERKGMRDNIKLGPGGIREIEFIVQAFQLVRGGRQSALQQRSVLDVLGALVMLGYLPEEVARQLAQAYVFLRRTENRLQAYDDQQVHSLPEDDTGRARLAFSMGYPGWAEFAAALAAHRNVVQQQFELVFAAPRDKAGAGQGRKTPGLEDVWRGSAGRETAVRVLAEAGYPDAEETLQWLQAFREGAVTRFLGEQGQQRLNELMPQLLQAAAGEAEPAEVLRRLGELLEAIAGRTTYLSLLVENPLALAQLTRLCGASAWVAAQLAQHPILLDELLDPRALYDPLDKQGLRRLLELRMSGIPAEDLEQQMDSLRQFRQAAVLHVAAADIVAGLSLAKVGDYLTWIAEVVLEKTLQLAWGHLVARHGRPLCKVNGKLEEAGFAIVAYGKLGGYELGYGSDLDVVFLHDSSGEEQQTSGPRVLANNEFFTRLSQRIIHILNTFTSAGILYEVDMRLRPNGASGMLVSSLEAFADYQRRSAWTWENQALVRARVVCGAEEIARRFERIRAGVLARPREAGELRREVVEMRERMRQELDKSDTDRVDLKQSRGGIVDVEFMVQCGVLLWSDAQAELLEFTDNLNLLDAFASYGLLPGEDVRLLAEAYCAIRQRINHLALQEKPPLTGTDELVAHRDAVARIWASFMLPGMKSKK
jgi:glutamate-ammonia-ligase adenylyltransferase